MKLFTYSMLTLFIHLPAIAADLNVELTNRKSLESNIICGLFESKAGFPMENKKASMVVNGSFEANKTVCTFSNIKVGRLAVAVQEDLNGNGVVDTTFVGFPKEPWGVSNDAPMHAFGPPKFEEAAIDFSGDATINIRLNQP